MNQVELLEQELARLKPHDPFKCAYEPCDGRYEQTNDIRIAQMHCPAGYIWRCNKCHRDAPGDRQAIIYKITKAK